MIRRFTTTFALGAAAAATLLASTSTSATAQAGPALAGMTPTMASYSVVAAPPPPAKKCAANFTSGVIGGQSKCLAAGQQCQQQNAGDYTRYGFDCNKVGTRFQLSRRGGAAPAPAKPAPAKPAPAKPAPAKPAPAGH